jgi:predicted ATP-grasp superfamily ATP-dependent carboligase
MPGFNRVHGTTSAASSFASGYAMTIFKIADSGSGFTADSVDGTTNEITEGGFVQALRVVQTIASVAYVGTRADAQFVVIVDGLTAGQTGLAYNSDTTPTVAERIKAELEDVFGATITVTDISGLVSGNLA